MKFAQYIFYAISLQSVLSIPVTYYKPLTPEEAKRLAEWTSNSKQPKWELSGQYQGDMIIRPKSRNGVTDESLRWPNREIVYELSNDFNEQEKQFIDQTLATEFAKTCVTARHRRFDEPDYVYVTGKDTGCWSDVGRIGGLQELNLDTNGCVDHGTILHEFLHTAGFEHQHSATERDDYLTILWENIMDGYAFAFEKYTEDMVTSFGEEYDYDSIMHYERYAFSANDQPTIVPKDPNADIGEKYNMSRTDIVKLNKMYKCI